MQTVDFFTPIVDDPYTYGQIAAANSLSDVYAMGGRPLTALAVAGFPKSLSDRAVIGEVFRGGYDKLREAGVALLGGHTVQDPEMKFGYAVTGAIDPARIWSNRGAREGDRILLTKPIGTGVIGTAIKRGQAPAGLVEQAVASMRTLNKAAAEALIPLDGVHACTDITGFGLLGHLGEMVAASPSGMGVQLDGSALRRLALPGALELLAAGHASTLAPANAQALALLEGPVSLQGDASAPLQQLLIDPQTCGPLLAAVPAERAAAAIAALQQQGFEQAAVIGQVMA